MDGERRKTILVTGGASGIGGAVAMRLAAQGDRVVVADADEVGAHAMLEQIRSAGGDGEAHRLDVRDEPAIEALVAGLDERHGGLDGAANCAGVEGPAARLTDLPMADWETVIAVNLTGVFACLRHEIASLRRAGRPGSIVNVASVAGLVGIAGSAAYNASKHAVVGLTRTAALENAARGIRVNAVCPGFTDTPMLDRVTEASDAMSETIAHAIPARRVATAEEIADAIGWLLGEESRYVTGVPLPVDGGWVAR